MRLNGWQRLWALAAAIWMILVVSMSYSLWPTAGSMQKAEVYSLMKIEDGKRLADYDYISETRPSQPIDSPWTVTSKEPLGPSVDIQGYKVQFSAGVSQEDMNQTARAFYSSLRRLLVAKQAEFIGEAFAAWIGPVVALYALGWAIGWVRRGFTEAT